MDSFDIVILAGQSNAEGNGVSTDKEPIVIDDAFELDDANQYEILLHEDGSYRGLKLVMPVETVIKPLQERLCNSTYFSDLSLSFAKQYIESGLLKEGRKLLVVKAAIGGTGFALNQQGVGNVLYERLLQMTNKALSLNKDNRIVAFLWHQGEHDAFENAKFDDKERYDFYYQKLKEQFQCYRNEFSQFTFPIITGGICDDWKNGYLHQCLAIESATKDVCKEIGFADFVSVEGLHSNHQDLDNSPDDIHFSKKSQNMLGKRYFALYQELIQKNLH